MEVLADSDWAGCHRTRKSTSGGAVGVCSHTVNAWARTQAVTVKSSVEADLYAPARSAREALIGANEPQVFLHLDSSIAKGTPKRQGISNARYLDVNVLGLQDQQTRNKVALKKMLGTVNPWVASRRSLEPGARPRRPG